MLAKNRKNPILNIANIISREFFLNSCIAFFSNTIASPINAIKPKKYLAPLKVRGPICSIPWSCAMNAVPHINVAAIAQVKDKILFKEKDSLGH